MSRSYGVCKIHSGLDRPEETEKTLTNDGWLHTGDLGRMDSDGYIFVTGRIKELIIKGGENIAPREIDEALMAHEACWKLPPFRSHVMIMDNALRHA